VKNIFLLEELMAIVSLGKLAVMWEQPGGGTIGRASAIQREKNSDLLNRVAGGIP
jgi:hypothetical protein